MLSYVTGFPIWFIASETDNGGMQVEMRSSTFDIQKIATHFGGGGHTFAAGFTYKEFSQDVVNELLELLASAVKKGNE